MIEDYIDDIDRRLFVSTRQRTRIIQDIHDHLTDAVEQLTAQGVDGPTAELQAAAAFGSPTDLAGQFDGQAAAIAMRRTPITMAASGVAVVGGFLLAAVTQPPTAVRPQAGIVQQVAFFTAVLGLQFAFVAGLRISVRAAARWRATPDHGDQVLLHRAMVVFGVGLAVAASGWTLVMADVLGGSNRRATTLVAGMVMMIGAAIVAGVVLALQHPHGQGEISRPEPVATDPSILGAAERGVRLIGRYPRTACALVAIVAGLAAMANADTTVGGALPWGIAQAAAVVAGFVLLGPALQIRPTKPTNPAQSSNVPG